MGRPAKFYALLHQCARGRVGDQFRLLRPHAYATPRNYPLVIANRLYARHTKLLMRHNKYKIGFLAAVALVGLRVGLGYHFFKEGYSHYLDPKWSSEPFRKAAKGPLAWFFTDPIDDFHGWSKLVLHPAKDPSLEKKDDKAKDKKVDAPKVDAKPDADQAKLDKVKSHAWYGWWLQVSADWNAWQRDIGQHYGYTAEQKEQVAVLTKESLYKLDDALAAYEPDIRAYQHELYRNEKIGSTPLGQEVPFMTKRLADRTKDPSTEKGVFGVDAKPAAWMADAKQVEKEFQAAVIAIANADQQKKFGRPVPEPNSVQKMDQFVTYSLIAIGICLMAGFLTPLAGLGGAGFLLSIVVSQPPWLPDTIPTYYQWIEILGLLLLAASCAGRFAGLDYFIAACCGKSGCCKGDSSCN